MTPCGPFYRQASGFSRVTAIPLRRTPHGTTAGAIRRRRPYSKRCRRLGGAAEESALRAQFEAEALQRALQYLRQKKLVTCETSIAAA